MTLLLPNALVGPRLENNIQSMMPRPAQTSLRLPYDLPPKCAAQRPSLP